jgi:prepilin-type N-terminal cleavage/methylation domain-containing protein
VEIEILEETATVERRGEKGFTLVELLIVIVILGVLSTIAVFAVRGISSRGETSACQADYKVLETATEAYLAQNGTTTAFPATAGAFETSLKTAGFIREESSKYSIVAYDDIDPVSGGACTYDPDGK